MSEFLSKTRICQNEFPNTLYQVGKGTPPQDRKTVESRAFDSDRKLGKLYRPYLRGSDIDRYVISPLEDRFIKYGPWLAEPRPAANFDAPRKILVRQTGDSLIAALDEQQYLCLNNLHVLVPANPRVNTQYVLGLLNSTLLNWYYQSLNPEVGEALAEVKKTNVAALPIRAIDSKSKNDAALAKRVAKHVQTIQEAHRRRLQLPRTLTAEVSHSHRTDCALAHYLQKDYAAAVTAEVLTDDVRRKGFVREILVQSGKKHIVITVEASDTKDASPVVQPIVRLTFANPALQQFMYASWRAFLEANARKQTWTTGKTPQPIYDLILNGLQPLAFFHPNSGDNLQVIRDLMKSVAKEAGTSDLAAVEAEIAETDHAINQLVYELYGLTEDEIRVVEEPRQ